MSQKVSLLRKINNFSYFSPSLQDQALRNSPVGYFSEGARFAAVAEAVGGGEYLPGITTSLRSVVIPFGKP